MAIDADLQPLLDRINERLDALEARPGLGGDVYVPPDTIVQTFPDGSVITYRKA